MKKLTVVVPMYNVSLFLCDALDTLLEQNLTSDELQVLLIDDGSSDETPTLAKGYEKKYPDIFSYHKFVNGGLGASRNRGTRLANSEYITYFDPDDKIVSGSYKKALDILAETNSDILIAGTKRFNSKKVWNSGIHEKSVTKDLRNVTFKEHPEFVWDSTAWNKIYKLDFIREHNLYNPEGILYEDMPMVMPALSLASSIDVMADTMYMWRARDFGTPSITQMSSNNTKPFLDRLIAMTSIINDLKKFDVSQTILDAQISKFLNFDIMIMFNKDRFGLFNDDQKNELYVSLKNFLNLFTPEQLKLSNFHDYVYYMKLLETKTLAEFSTLTLGFLQGEVTYHGEWINNQYVLGSSLSDITMVARGVDFELIPKIETVNMSSLGINIDGYVYAKYADMSRKELVQDASLTLLDDNCDVIKSSIGHVNFQKNHRITSSFGYNSNHFEKDGADFNYDYSEYHITLPFEELEKLGTNNFRIKINFKVDNINVSEFVKNPVSGKDTRPDAYVTEKNDVYSIQYDTSSWNIVLKSLNSVPTIWKSDRNKLITNVEGQNLFLKSKDSLKQLKVFKHQILFPVNVTQQFNEFNTSIRSEWQFVTYDEKHKLVPVYYKSQPLKANNATSLEYTFANKFGKAIHKLTWNYPIVKKVFLIKDTLHLEFELNGWLREAKNVQVLADRKLPDLLWDTEYITENIYAVDIPLTFDGFGDKPWLNFHVKLTFEDSYETDELLRWGPEKFELQNKWISVNKIGWYISYVSRFDFGGFAIKRTADRVFSRVEGNLNRFIETTYRKWLEEPVNEKFVMMSSFWGRDNKFNDNPQAIYEYLANNRPEFTTIIMMKDAIRTYPEYPNAKVVSYGTKEYWYYLAHAKYFVNNVNYTESQRVKRPDQIEIQTMHGTPLKTLGFEVLEDWNDKNYQSQKRKNANWDYLLTPSDWVADYAVKAFAVQPKILNTGYPRNDQLFISRSAKQVEDLKRSLNLPLNKKIVAYTPTWRQKEPTTIDNYLDVKELYKALPDDVYFVIKNHHFEPWSGLSNEYADKIGFMSGEASIDDVYIIADCLITDYSSVMFDYSLLNKPMIFYAFDYDQYVEERGLNFDLRKFAPGPIANNQNDLVKWITNFNTIESKFSKSIKKFKTRFSQYDDGHAAEKVVNTVFK